AARRSAGSRGRGSRHRARRSPRSWRSHRSCGTSGRLVIAGCLVVAEQLLDPPPPLFEAVQRQPELGYHVADHVIGGIPLEPDQQGPFIRPGREAAPGQLGRQLPPALVDLDREHLADPGEAGHRVGAQQPAALQRHHVVTDSLDLPQQVRGDHDGDAELPADPGDQVEHRPPAARVEAGGRLVEQQQPRVTDQRLGQLDPLLHPGRIGADQPVPLLVQPDMAQGLGGPLFGRRSRESGHPAQVGHELGAGDVGRQAVVLGHVAGEGADPFRVYRGVAAEHARPAVGGRDQAQQDLDQCGLAGAVRADQPRDPGREHGREPVQGGHAARVPLGQRLGLDDTGRGETGFAHGALDDATVAHKIPAFQPDGRSVIGRESVLGVRPRAYPGLRPPGGLVPRADAANCLRRYREFVNAQSPPVPAGTDEMAARPPGSARPAASPAPPLTMRIRRTHWMVLDYVVAAVCALIIFGTLFHGVALARLPVTGWHAQVWLPPLLAVCLSIPVAIRRREPVLAFAVILAVCAGVLVLRGELTRGPVLPLALVLYVVAATRGRRAALAALAAALALLTVQGVILSLTGRGAGNAVGAGLVLIICWMIGYSVGQSRSYASRLQQQAMDNAVTAERLRIARELHDVVAHSMTVVAVQ